MDVALVANVKAAAAAVLRERHRRSPRSTVIDDRRAAVLRYSRERRRKLDEAAKQVWSTTPISVERLAVELNRRLDPGSILACEIISEEQVADAYFDLYEGAAGRRQLITSGGCLGWGVAAAIGAKIAQPDRQVAALVGDGSFQFGVQALWTAARYEVPILVVIFDNNAYQANRKYLQQYGGRAAKTGRYIGSWLGSPEIDHVSISKAYGVDAEHVIDPNQIGSALDRAARATSDGRPYVLDVKIRPRFDSTWHDFFSVARRLPRQT
ncbi:MAG: hypothetical protein HYS05_07425 [Acidobacteria bacterium]|nr:hypothetical protein [Acidobacteriota bacterium]